MSEIMAGSAGPGPTYEADGVAASKAPEGRDAPAVPDVIVCPGGPLLLRGEHVVQGADGVTHTTTRPISAVCRCGASATIPWCDGTHKQMRHPPVDRPARRPV